MTLPPVVLGSGAVFGERRMVVAAVPAGPGPGYVNVCFLMEMANMCVVMCMTVFVCNTIVNLNTTVPGDTIGAVASN